MRLRKAQGQWLVDQIGLDEPLKFPPVMDKQDVARAVMQRYGDQIRARAGRHQELRGMSPEQGATIGAGHTTEMMSDFLHRPMTHFPAYWTTPESRAQEQAEMDIRREDRRQAAIEIPQYNEGFGYGQMIPYFTPPAGAGSRAIEGLMTRLGVERLPGMSRAPELVGRSATADAAAQGAVLGAASDEGGALEGAVYGGAGGLLAKSLAKALQPVDSRLDPYEQQMMDRGRELGFKLSPAKATGSKGLQRFEEALEQNIITGGLGDPLRAHNQANANRIVMEALGFKGPYKRLTPKMLDDVSEDFNDRFGELTQGQAVYLDDPNFMDKLVRLESETVDYPLYNKDFKDVIQKTVDMIADGDGWLSGEQYKVLNTKLTKGIRAGYKPNSGQSDFADELVEFKDALDDAAMASLGPDVLDRYRNTRADYRVFSALMKNSVIDEDSGNVSLRQLGNVLRREDRYGFRRGKNTSDLYDATRFERTFPPLPGISPTARLQSLPQTVAASTMMGGAAGLMSGDPFTGGAAAAGLPASLYAMGRYYNSPMGRKHFSGGLAPISDAWRRMLGQKIGMAAVGASQGTGTLPQQPPIPIMQPRPQ